MKIVLTVETICEILKMPNTDHKHYFWSKRDYSKVIPMNTVSPTICNEIYQGEKLTHHKYLNDRARVINRIVSHNIIPRAKHYETMQPLQALITYAVLDGWPLNFGHIIFNFMMTFERRGGSLPFSMALTKIFQHFGVDLVGASKEKVPNPFDGGTLTKWW